MIQVMPWLPSRPALKGPVITKLNYTYGVEKSETHYMLTETP